MPSSLPRRALMCLTLFLAVLCPRPSPALEPGELNPEPFELLLKKYVAEGRVDYARWKSGGITELDAFLDSLAAYDLTSVMGKEPRAAVLLNAYHAWVIRQVLEHYPVKSVKDIPGFFDKNTHKIAGEERTLNDIEAALDALLPRQPEFALVLSNGTMSGPPMVEEAFRSDNLARRLNQGLKDAAHSKRIWYDAKTNEMHYAPQIVKYLPRYQALPNGMAGKFGSTISLAEVMALSTKNPKVVEEPQDWSLNGLPPPTRAIQEP
ncbi:MAG TPA: DUF547 domain-containing protein [Candidatus Eisenbacteria bacterium]|nr:DUF547 domain-containing protein [Candidatus Eisenbacteria bacterium]